MAGKTKFDQDAAFKSIIGVGREPEAAPAGKPEAPAGKPAGKAPGGARVQRAYYLDRELDTDLRRKALEEGKSLTDSVNEALRAALKKYL